MKNYLLAALAALTISEVMIVRAEAIEGNVHIAVEPSATDWRDSSMAVVLGGASAVNVAHLVLSSATATTPGGIIAARIGASILGGAAAIWFAQSKPFFRNAMKKSVTRRKLSTAQTTVGRAVDRAVLATENASQKVVDTAVAAKDKMKEAASTVRDKVGDAMTATRNKTASVLETAAEKVKTDKTK